MKNDLQTTLISANVILEFDGTMWAIRVDDGYVSYSKLFFDTFPLPKDLGNTLIEFLETYYVKEIDKDGNSVGEDA